jgi:GT2 family glycosyltransferase
MVDHHQGCVRDGRTGVVIASQDRLGPLAHTLERVLSLPERPPVVLVDNASTDGTVAAVRQRFPSVEVIALPRNEGGAARTRGVERLSTPYIAFCDDDSWWSPGALTRAADLLDEHPALGLLAARILVGDQERLDPTSKRMSASPLRRDPSLPGVPVLGFLACGAIVRREAYLDVGGFESRLGVGGEEELLALDLAAAGWSLVYVDDVVAHHDPPPRPDPGPRTRRLVRNELWTTWMRRPPAAAFRNTARLLLDAHSDRERSRGVADALRGLPWALRNRRSLPSEVEARLRALESRA